MTDTLTKIREMELQIKRYKQTLILISKEVNSLSNPRLVSVSQVLDKKLNDYYRLKTQGIQS